MQRNEAVQRLDDVMELIETSFIQKEVGNENEWRNGMRKAGELLEGLLNLEKLPIRLLSAAAYQLADYPAIAVKLLKNNNTNSVESEILRCFLKADFPSLLENLSQYWTRQLSHETNLAFSSNNYNTFVDDLNQVIIDETARSLGILCASIRWGDEPRLTKAIDKLSNISKVQLYGNNTYSWLLAKLCAEVAKVYVESSMRHHLESSSQSLNPLDKNSHPKPPSQFSVYLLRNFNNALHSTWRVIPVETSQEIYWLDLAGFQLAKCAKIENWQSSYLNDYDFILDASKQIVTSKINFMQLRRRS